MACEHVMWSAQAAVTALTHTHTQEVLSRRHLQTHWCRASIFLAKSHRPSIRGAEHERDGRCWAADEKRRVYLWTLVDFQVMNSLSAGNLPVVNEASHLKSALPLCVCTRVQRAHMPPQG